MIIDSVIRNEKKRNEKMRVAYEDELRKLPKGSLSIKTLNGKSYCYLRYRKGDKVISEYIGAADLAEEINNKINRRKHLQSMLKLLNAENKRILKMEKVK